MGLQSAIGIGVQLQIYKRIFNFAKLEIQAGAELGQAQDKLKVIVDVGVEVEDEDEVNHY